MLACTKCGHERDELGYKMCSSCREKNRLWLKRWKKQHPAKYRAVVKKINTSEAHRAGLKRYRQRHREEFTAYHAEYFRQYRLANQARIDLAREIKKQIGAGKITRPTNCKACGKTDCETIAFLSGLAERHEANKAKFYCRKCHQTKTDQFKKRQAMRGNTRDQAAIRNVST